MHHHAPPRSWAEIDLSALQHNYRYAQQQAGGAEVMAVVKANAYGHGYERVIRALHPLGPAFYGVANVREAREVRAIFPDARVYLLGIANPAEYEEIVTQDYTACISSMEGLAAYSALAQQHRRVLRVHFALDTGMGRGGFIPESPQWQEALQYQHPHIQVEGVGSHLPVADEDAAFTHQQIAHFRQQIPAGLRYQHLANSAGILDFPDSAFNLVRPGLMLYGVSPLPQYQDALRPVMRLCSRVSIVRDIPAGQGISYGRTFITTRPSRIATVGIGYADGIPRAISGQPVNVWINGASCPIVGRVTMDQIMVDVTDHPQVTAGDTVELFGANVPVTQLANAARTIPWEIFTGIAPRVLRT